MTIYLLKVVICSSVFLLAYKLLIEVTAVHHFKRFYLIFSLLFSFVVPWLTISSPASPISYTTGNIQDILYMKDSFPANVFSAEGSDLTVSKIFIGFYITISISLSIRLYRNLVRLLSKIKMSDVAPYKDSRIILVNENISPYTFLNYVFISKIDHEKGNIKDEILLHENAHVEQKHSYDILFIELVRIFFWINPAVFFFKKAIQLNHEFLADAVVMQQSKNIKLYKYLLVGNSVSNSQYNIVSQFNYSTIKNRLIMMSKKQSVADTLIRHIFLFTFVLLTVMALSSKSFSQRVDQVYNSKLKGSPGVSELPKFKILIESTKDGLKLTASEGCAWSELSFDILNDKFQLIDEFGMVDPSEQKSKEVSKFQFRISKTAKGIALEGRIGTAWNELSFACVQGKCRQVIDASGMVQQP